MMITSGQLFLEVGETAGREAVAVRACFEASYPYTTTVVV